MNYRGMGNTPLLTPRLYCAANDDDLRTALKHIRKSNPNSKLLAIGVSLGGILLGRYLISSGYKSAIDAAFLVSVAWDCTICATSSMETGLNSALNQFLTKSLISIVKYHQHLLHDMEVEWNSVYNARNMREFDEAFTIRMFNFESVSHYYGEASHKGKLARIKTPTFCINAADDMFAPIEGNKMVLRVGIVWQIQYSQQDCRWTKWNKVAMLRCWSPTVAVTLASWRDSFQTSKQPSTRNEWLNNTCRHCTGCLTFVVIFFLVRFVFFFTS